MNPGEKTRIRTSVNTSPLMSWVSWGALSCFCSAPRQHPSLFGVTTPALLPLIPHRALLTPDSVSKVALKLFERTKPPRSPLRNETKACTLRGRFTCQRGAAGPIRACCPQPCSGEVAGGKEQSGLRRSPPNPLPLGLGVSLTPSTSPSPFLG